MTSIFFQAISYLLTLFYNLRSDFLIINEMITLKEINQWHNCYINGLLTHTIMHHSFADDLQLQMSAPPDEISELLRSMQSCICDVKAQATANMRKLNDNKTDLMLVTSKRTKQELSFSIIYLLQSL